MKTWSAYILGTGWLLVATSCTMARVRPACLEPSIRDSHLRDPNAEQWLTSLLRGPNRDCRGDPVEQAPAPKNCPTDDLKGTLLPPREVGVADVVVEPVDRYRRLVWVIARSLDNGEAIGPVALATLTEDALEITTLGTLRTFADAPQLEILRLGQGEVLAAKGKRCVNDHCARHARLLVRRQSSWVDVPLQDPGGRCVGPARIDLDRTRTTRIGQGWIQVQRLTTSYEVLDGKLVLHETVTVEELDPSRVDSTRREVSRSQDSRAIWWSNGYLTVDRPSLWTRLPASN